MAGKLDINDILDLEAYPLDETTGVARAALIDDCRAALERDLYCVLPGFVTPPALDRMAAEARALRPQAYDNNSRRNCYLQRAGDPSLASDHARNSLEHTSTRMIAYDQVPPDSPLKTFYHSALVRELVAAITGEGELFDNEDPYQPANYVCYEAGDRSAWHFDSDNAFTMTLMVQAAESGGSFEMSPHTRTDDDENYDHVAAVLRGERPESVVSVGREPGALCIFRGCNALHRVSTVQGDTMRIMGVFVYERTPGVRGDPEVNATIYGARASA